MEIIFSIISIAILIAVVSFSYAYIKLEKQETDVNVLGTDCIKLEMIEETNAITIQNTFPVSDEVGKTTTPYRFKLRNDCGVGLNYEIHLEVEEGNTMNAKNVATMVDSNNKIVLTSDQKINEETKEKYRISKVLTLEPYKEVEHEVRIWLDSSADNETQNKKFLSKVIIEAVQNQSVCTYESKWDFDYTNDEQTFTVPCDGVYLLEVWGGQGGGTQTGGYGGYATGEITLTANATLYINVGGQGNVNIGGYNGGGDGLTNTVQGSLSGGGATHIATISSLLSSLEAHKDDNTILIVAGGGGGGNVYGALGGSGGGFQGKNGINSVGVGANYLGTGATQSEGGHDTTFVRAEESKGKFGLGGKAYAEMACNGICGGFGGGGGYYGGGGSSRGHAGAGGGSGYIGNELLMNKGMWCYECDASDEDNTKTTSTDQVSEEPTSMYAKQGNGFARITYLRIK